jgi:hypothetical protein
MTCGDALQRLSHSGTLRASVKVVSSIMVASMPPSVRLAKHRFPDTADVALPDG